MQVTNNTASNTQAAMAALSEQNAKVKAAAQVAGGGGVPVQNGDAQALSAAVQALATGSTMNISA